MTHKSQKPRRPKKRAYGEPKLKIYGNLRTLTKGTMKGGTLDDGGSPKPSTRSTGPNG